MDAEAELQPPDLQFWTTPMARTDHFREIMYKFQIHSFIKQAKYYDVG